MCFFPLFPFPVENHQVTHIRTQHVVRGQPYYVYFHRENPWVFPWNIHEFHPLDGIFNPPGGSLCRAWPGGLVQRAQRAECWDKGEEAVREFQGCVSPSNRGVKRSGISGVRVSPSNRGVKTVKPIIHLPFYGEFLIKIWFGMVYCWVCLISGEIGDCLTNNISNNEEVRSIWTNLITIWQFDLTRDCG